LCKHTIYFYAISQTQFAQTRTHTFLYKINTFNTTLGESFACYG